MVKSSQDLLKLRSGFILSEKANTYDLPTTKAFNRKNVNEYFDQVFGVTVTQNFVNFLILLTTFVQLTTAFGDKNPFPGDFSLQEKALQFRLHPVLVKSGASIVQK